MVRVQQLRQGAELGFRPRLISYMEWTALRLLLLGPSGGLHRVGHLCSYLSLNGHRGNCPLGFPRLKYTLPRVVVLTSGLDSCKLCQVLPGRVLGVLCSEQGLVVLPHSLQHISRADSVFMLLKSSNRVMQRLVTHVYYFKMTNRLILANNVKKITLYFLASVTSSPNQT